MKKQLYTVTLATATLGLLTGCATGQPKDKAVTTQPTPCVLTPDSAGQVNLDVRFQIPQNYFSKRSRLVITPQLFTADTLYQELVPLVLDAPIYQKKRKRKVQLEGYVDPYTGQAIAVNQPSHAFEMPYRESVQIPTEADHARIVGIVTTDGCGECTGLDTIDIAAISNPTTLINVKKSLDLAWIEPEFVIRPKIAKGKGVAHLQFHINKHYIDPALGHNRQELEQMEATLAPILNDSLATLTSLSIYGMASADGSLSFNTPLARNRAESARRWLIDRLAINAPTQRIIQVGSRPEGWLPVLEAMRADGSPDTAAVKSILEKYAESNDDIQERYIRRLPCWKEIRAKYLQKDRKVEYVYTYTIRSFTTDAELLDMYEKRPDAFNEEELLRVASLAETAERKKQVYQTLMKYFPQSKVAANNLAVLYLREGKEEEARKVLDRLQEHSEETLNTLAASYVYAGDYERAIELLEEVDLPAARYNLGLLKAKQRKLHEAYELLHPYGDLNSAIVALSLNRNREAKDLLQRLDNHEPKAEYIRALTAARLLEDQAFYRHLPQACQDEKLRQRARHEADFSRYHGEALFESTIGKLQTPKE